MQHLDEGTAHAWLDGALSASDAAEVERHIAACTACAEVVAEARGLIAASTRIVSALDGVPPAVLPSTSRPPQAAGDVAGAARARAHRQWWRGPQFAAAASLAIIAAGSWAIWRNSATRSFDAAVGVPSTERAVAAPSAVQRFDSEALGPARGTAKSAPSSVTLATAAERKDERRAAANAALPTPGSAPRNAARLQQKRRPSERDVDALAPQAGRAAPAFAEAKREAPTRPAAAPPIEAPLRDSARVVTANVQERADVSGAAAQPTRKVAVSPESVVAAETRRLRDEVVVPQRSRQANQLGEVVATGATVRSMAGNCYALTPVPNATAAGALPSTVRLTTQVADSARREFLALTPGGTPQGRWHWSNAPDGFVLVPIAGNGSRQARLELGRDFVATQRPCS